MLKETCEYADYDEQMLLTAAGRTTTKSGFAEAKAKKAPKLDNDWIPTEAVRAIMKIKEDFKGSLTETAVSQILYELNAIWRNIMRKEIDAVKKRLTA
jgi:isocitrate dehydrogenase